MQAKVYTYNTLELESGKMHTHTYLNLDRAVSEMEMFEDDPERDVASGIRSHTILDFEELFKDDAPLEEINPEQKVVQFRGTKGE